MKTHTLVISAALGLLAGCAGDQGEPGAVGEAGPKGSSKDGTVCWDRDNSGTCGPSEDVDRSGDCDVGDCRGPIGPIGPAGPQGAAGAQGVQGPVGPQGELGAVGPQGPVGPRGFQGATGPLGNQGVQGPQGPVGPKGPPGPRGNVIAEYEFDEDAGAIEFVDGTGLKNKAIATQGTVTAGSAVAHSGKSINLTGVEGVQVEAGNTIADPAQIWPDMWIRTNQPTGTYTLLEKVGSYRLRISSGQLQWTVFTTGGQCSINHDVTIANDQWVHVSGLFDGQTVAVEIDGVTRSTACRTGRVVPQQGAALAIGGKWNGAAWSEVFRGYIDEVRVRSTADYTVGRVRGSCALGQAITSIAPDGSVTCADVRPQRVFRYATFDTYSEQCCWVMENRPELFGGVHPSNWTNGSYQANNMTNNSETLRTLFTKKVFPGINALVTSERFRDNSSTNGRVSVALMRIRNTTANPISWTPYMYFTAYASWDERASIALNGQNVWNSCCGNYGPNAAVAPTMTLPPNQTSTVIFVSTSSYTWNANGLYRMSVMLFYNDSLNLPQGLQFVDDLDTVQGNLW